MGPDVMIFIFWMLSFKPSFSLYSFTFIKRLFSSSSLSAIRVVSSAYLRLLIFLPAILIPACASSSPVFLMMYSAHKLNKQGDNIQPTIKKHLKICITSWHYLDIFIMFYKRIGQQWIGKNTELAPPHRWPRSTVLKDVTLRRKYFKETTFLHLFSLSLSQRLCIGRHGSCR